MCHCEGPRGAAGTEIERGKYQPLFSAGDVNLLCENINTVKRNTESLLIASAEVGLEVNAEKAKYMSISCEEYAKINAT
jgi:hypothetical protein